MVSNTHGMRMEKESGEQIGKMDTNTGYALVGFRMVEKNGNHILKTIKTWPLLGMVRKWK